MTNRLPVEHGRFSPITLAVLAGLLAPLAWYAAQVAPRPVALGLAGWTLLASAATYLLYARDKRQARRDGWRTSEKTLQLGALLGGWPGAFVAQRRLRHKTRKFGFQLLFWVIVAGHVYAALDATRGGEISRLLWRRWGV